MRCHLLLCHIISAFRQSQNLLALNPSFGFLVFFPFFLARERVNPSQPLCPISPGTLSLRPNKEPKVGSSFIEIRVTLFLSSTDWCCSGDTNPIFFIFFCSLVLPFLGLKLFFFYFLLHLAIIDFVFTKDTPQ